MLRQMALGALVGALTVGGCSTGGDEGGVPRDRFEAGVAERYETTDEQAACIAAYVYDDYDTAAVRTLHEGGVTALPQALWDPFLQSVIGCTVSPESLDP